MDENLGQDSSNELVREQNLTKSERNALKREQKQKEREKEIRAKKMKKIIVWVVVAAVIAGGIYWLSIIIQKSNSSRPGEAISILGRTHISVGDAHEEYNSNPPTSGSHAGPARWGFSNAELPDENLIHNLEHGGIWISYKNLDERSIDILRKIARENSRSVVVTPREKNDVNVAVASWGRLLKLDSVDEVQIIDFIRKNKNKSPERLAI